MDCIDHHDHNTLDIDDIDARPFLNDFFLFLNICRTFMLKSMRIVQEIVQRTQKRCSEATVKIVELHELWVSTQRNVTFLCVIEMTFYFILFYFIFNAENWTILTLKPVCLSTIMNKFH